MVMVACGTSRHRPYLALPLLLRHGGISLREACPVANFGRPPPTPLYQHHRKGPTDHSTDPHPPCWGMPLVLHTRTSRRPTASTGTTHMPPAPPNIINHPRTGCQEPPGQTKEPDHPLPPNRTA